ncbi:MAG TPA: guanylate kinase [Gemmatimonadaceae bacterium]|nr:guanylate kinase [Gemmatimonadaceae bacterium]
MKPFPIILSAPSGGGKTTITRRLLERRRDVGYSVSCTTRLPRAGEVDGRDYHFVSTGEFLAGRDRGDFAESAEVHGRLYGTLRREVQRVLGSGRHVVMDIDVQGADQFVRAFPESVTIFLLPPSAEVLLGRLTARKTEDNASLRLRVQSAVDELRAVVRYQYVVVNDDLDGAVARVAAVIDAEMVRRTRLPELEPRVNALIGHLVGEIDRLQP